MKKQFNNFSKIDIKNGINGFNNNNSVHSVISNFG
jgi:hypothetical protein